MSEPDERQRLICRPVRWQKHPLPGAVKMLCQRCGQTVWVSPSTFLVTPIEACELVCEECAGPVKDSPMLVTEAQMVELVKLTGYTEETILARLRKHFKNLIYEGEAN